MPHVDRAGQIRRLAAKPADPASTTDHPVASEANESDLSSDEDENAEPEAEDIDSDDLDDEFIEGVDESGRQALEDQDDFVGF